MHPLTFRLFRRQRVYSSMNACLKCQKETKNKKYCSNHCANSANGSLFPKRKRSQESISCKGCQNTIPKRERVLYCKVCRPKKNYWGRLNLDLQMTLAEFRKRYSCKGTARNNPVRYIAHQLNAELKKTIRKCQVCHYDKHVELCHIKAISDFEESATLFEISGPHNIAFLCPNHHWELDNGHILVAPAGIAPAASAFEALRSIC